MASTLKIVNLLVRTNYDDYYVRSITNAIEPKPGTTVTEREVKLMIRDGIRVNITYENSG